jgi:SAM-dependent methyltransferase
MYDAFSSDYDRFVNWPARLSFELPFIESQLQAVGGAQCRVLDAACGTGQHVIALRQRGFQADGADLSPAMIALAQQNAAQAGVTARFEAVGFGELAPVFSQPPYDALLCLGNSLPHLLTPEHLDAGLADFARCLRPDGLLLLQNRNFDALMAERQRWMEPQSFREGEAEWLFLRFYDYDPDGLITFNILTLQRRAQDPWQQRISTTRLRPLLAEDLLARLAGAGFEQVSTYSSLGGEPFDPGRSGNLVVTAHSTAR